MTDNSGQSVSEGTPAGRPWTRQPLFRNSPAVKMVLIGFVTLLLLVPSTFTWVLVEERADRARDVARDIASSWGGVQEINGPYLVVPFSETYQSGSGDKARTQVDWRSAVLFPEKLDVTGDIAVEERKKSIYSLPVYHGKFNLKGRFAAASLDGLAPQHGGTIDIAADKAVLVIGVGDITALKSEVLLKLDGAGSVPFEPGGGSLSMGAAADVLNASSRAGINAAIPALKWQSGFSFEIPLQLNGSSAIYVAPAGQTTKVELQSDWPHPGFTGAYLPETRQITDSGFSADWTIPYLARGIPKLVETSRIPILTNLFGVKFIEPVDYYQTISRSLKYAIGFVSLTFLAVFVLEMRSGWSFHWIQYGLVGLGLIIFYVMLLAFAEHIGYGPAYLLAAAAATILNAAYVGTSLRSRMAGIVMLGVLSAIYAVLFALMREQDYALLIGSVLAFATLAITMFITQRIDWSGQQGSVRSEAPSPA